MEEEYNTKEFIMIMIKKNFVLIILFFALLLSVILFASYLNSQGSSCMKNPFVFGADKMGEGTYCSCTISQNNCMTSFSFNTDELKFGASSCKP